MKRIILIAGAIVVAMVLGAAGLAIALFYSHHRVTLLSKAPEHGTAYLLELEAAKPGGDTDGLAETKDALRKRFFNLGVSMFWEPVSPTQFRVIVPPIGTDTHSQFPMEHLVSGGQLEFRLIHEESAQLVAQGVIEPGFEVLKLQQAQRNSTPATFSFLVEKKPQLTGKYVSHATAMHDQMGQPEIFFTLTAEGAAIFGKVTRENIGRQLGIVLDGKLESAPRIASEIGGNGVITGQFTEAEASAVAEALNAPLPFPIKVMEVKVF